MTKFGDRHLSGVKCSLVKLKSPARCVCPPPVVVRPSPGLVGRERGPVFFRFFNGNCRRAHDRWWSLHLSEGWRDVLRGGCPGFVDWEGRKAHFIGIEPVHWEWTIVDGRGGQSPR